MTTKTIKDVFDILIAEYTSNKALTDWCDLTYGERPKIYIGIDDEDIPEISGNLAIRIVTGSRSRTRTMAYRAYGLKITGIIREPETATEDNIITIEGLEHIDRFISLIEEATIPVIQNSSIAITPLDGDMDSIAYPFIKAELSYLIEIPSKLP